MGIISVADQTNEQRTKCCAASGLRREVNEISALLGYYAEHSVNILPKFRGNLSVPSSMVRIS